MSDEDDDAFSNQVFSKSKADFFGLTFSFQASTAIDEDEQELLRARHTSLPPPATVDDAVQRLNALLAKSEQLAQFTKEV